MQLCIDGIPNARNATPSATMLQNQAAMKDAEGPCVGFGEGFFSGQLDEQMIFSTALSAREIRQVIRRFAA